MTAPDDKLCAECGHRHAGPELGRICIGCPCPLFVAAAKTRMVGIDPDDWQRRVAEAEEREAARGRGGRDD